MLLCAALYVSSVVSPGTAQTDYSTAVRVLREGRDFRARARACLALANSNDPSLVPHLVAALSDSSPAVRAAAAAGLGRLGDASVLGALRRAAADEASVVRLEAERAIQRIEANATIAIPSGPRGAFVRTETRPGLPAASVVPQARAINWPVVRYVVVVGSLENRSAYRHHSLDRVLAREVMRNLVGLRGVAVMREGEEPEDAAREIRRRRLPKLRLEGSLNRVDRRGVSRQLSVRCEVSLMLLEEPGRSIRGVLTGVATGTSPERGARDEQERYLAEQALAGAVRTAMSGAAQAIARVGR